MPILDDIDRLLRDHERYLGNGGTQALPIGDRSSSVRPIYKSDLRELLRLIVAAGGSGGGVGIASSSYNATTGRITLNFTDGTSSQTGDLRGPPGDDGDDGVGISGSSYDTETGAITLTFTNGTTFTTGDLRGEGGSDSADTFSTYAEALAYAPAAPASRTRISFIVGGHVFSCIRQAGGTCLGGGWAPDGKAMPPHWGAFGTGLSDDAPAIQAMATWVNARSSIQRPKFKFPKGFWWRLGFTVDFNFGGGRAGNIDMESPIRPDPGIGDAFRIYNGRGGKLNLWVDGGGQTADYSVANPVGGDQAFMLRGLRGAEVSVRGYNYKGRVLRVTEAAAGEFKTSRFYFPFIQTGDISGATSEICGQGWFCDVNGTAFGYIGRAWINWDQYGSVFEDTIDITFGGIEGGNYGNGGAMGSIEFRGCASVTGDKIAFGDEQYISQALVWFKDSATRRCWNINIDKMFLIGSVNGLRMENVGFDLSGNKRPGITIGQINTIDMSGAGVLAVNCHDVKMAHDSYRDREALVVSGAFTDCDLNVNYRDTERGAITIPSGCGRGLRLTGKVETSNTDGAAGIHAIDIQSLEPIDANGLSVSGSAVVSLINLAPNNAFRMRGGSLTQAGATVKFGGSAPRLADAVTGYVNSLRGSTTILSGQSSVIVTHGMDVAPSFVNPVPRNSDTNGSRLRPSSIGPSTFAIQTITGTVAADSAVDWEAKAGNAP